MADPLTLAVVGTVAVTEGVKFLYNQAGELLKYWREKKKAAAAAAAIPPPQPPEVKLPPEAFEGQLASPKVHDEVLERVQQNIAELRKGLSGYADEVEEIEPGNEALLRQVDALRQLLEAVYQQRITFKGEMDRAPSGPVVEGTIDVDEVEGYAAANIVKNVTGGRVYGKATAKSVKRGGTLAGNVIDNVGPGSKDADE